MSGTSSWNIADSVENGMWDVKIKAPPDVVRENRVLDRVKVGEIYHLADNDVSFVCSQCEEEFSLLSSFTAHIQIHLWDILTNVNKSSLLEESFDDIIDIKPSNLPTLMEVGSNDDPNTHDSSRVQADNVDMELSKGITILSVEFCQCAHFHTDRFHITC